MTTQTTPPTDNERIAHLEGLVEQIVARLDSIERRLDNLEARLDSLQSRLDGRIDSLRNLMFMGFGLLWATMVGGFIAILTFNT